jgi:hypothetical protein
MSAKAADGTGVFSKGRQLRKTQPYRRRDIDKNAADLGAARTTAGSTFPQFLQLRDERRRAIGEVAVKLPELLSIGVEHNDGGKP